MPQKSILSFFGTKVENKGSLSKSTADTKIDNKITNEMASNKKDKEKEIFLTTKSNKAIENTLIKKITKIEEKKAPIKRKKELVNNKESSDEDSPLKVKKKKRRTKLNSTSSEDSNSEPMSRSVKQELRTESNGDEMGKSYKDVICKYKHVPEPLFNDVRRYWNADEMKNEIKIKKDSNKNTKKTDESSSSDCVNKNKNGLEKNLKTSLSSTKEEEKRSYNLNDATENEQLSKIGTTSDDKNKVQNEVKISAGSFFGVKSETKINNRVYDPSKTNYDPIKHACWSKEDEMPYIALAQTLKTIEETPGRLMKIEALCNFFRSVIVLSPEQLTSCVYLFLNKIAPTYEGIELGIGDFILKSVVKDVCGKSLKQINKDMEELGDIGLVTEKGKQSQRLLVSPAKLTIKRVFSTLKKIATTTGGSSRDLKIKLIRGMINSCKGCETRYIMRSLSGKLRIQMGEKSVLPALTKAILMTPPAQEYPPKILNAMDETTPAKFKNLVETKNQIVKNANCEMPNYEVLISTMLKYGIDELPKYCKLTPGIPLYPMLAQPSKGIRLVTEKFGDCQFTCEYKYDGERAQIHVCDDGKIKIFSRNMENNTTKYPDIISRMPNVMQEGVKSCIIDSEAVAWDKNEKTILPFQILTTRKRKDAKQSEIKVQVCIYAFDLLYLNGKSLTKEPLRKRRQLLRENFKETEGEFVFAASKDTNDVEEIQNLIDESVKGNCEGLMVKTLDKDATYEIAIRSNNWLKLKKDYLDGVGDTLDLVVIGGARGKGRRTGTFGNYLLACYDDENEEYQVITKIGTGFSDQDLEDQAKFLKNHIIEKPKSYYRLNGISADVWFEPIQVWEVKAADFSISPIYTAASGIVDPNKGISMRFPRFIRIRDDKKPEQATTSEQVADFYNKQQIVVNQEKAKKNKKEEDFY